MDTVQATFYLAIATFVLAFFAMISAVATAWMARETKESNKLNRKMVEYIRDIAAGM